MQSNSKLTKAQKTALKRMIKFMPHVQFAQTEKTTIAFAHVGNLVEFSTAICADNEKKNRPKVGKFYAIERFENMQTVKMRFADFNNMIDNMITG
jgi:uncharacterized protein YkvS